MSLALPANLITAHMHFNLACTLGDDYGCERQDELADAASDENLVDAAIVDAVACATDDAACGKVREKVPAMTPPTNPKPSGAHGFAWKAITKNCD